MWTKITLRVHPFFGKEVRVRRRFRGEMLEVEVEDGRIRRLPAKWTSLGEHLSNSALGQAARLSPKAALELSGWVSSRLEEEKAHGKLGRFNKSGQRLGRDGGQATRQEGGSRRDSRSGGVIAAREARSGASALVGQAGASRVDGGSEQSARRRRGGRK